MKKDILMKIAHVKYYTTANKEFYKYCEDLSIYPPYLDEFLQNIENDLSDILTTIEETNDE